MQAQKISVYWRGKFNGALVQINEAEFNPELHRRAADGPWPEDAQPNRGARQPAPIPANFPGAVALANVGVTDFSELLGATTEKLTQIKGIGQATAEAIMAELAKL